jgi:phage tail-like protein
MDGDRGLSLIVDSDQWLRCAHVNTALLDGGGVTLTWAEHPECALECATPSPAQSDSECTRVDRAGGLAFDRWCRAYVSRPERGRVDVTTWPAGDSATSPCPGDLRHPTGLAVDRQQRLYIVEAGADVVDVVDLVAQRLLRKVALCGRPMDVAAVCGRALVLLREPPSLVWIDGRRGPLTGPSLEKPCGYGPLTAHRVASGPLVLWRRPGGEYAVIARSNGDVLFELAAATDLAIDLSGLLVIAQRPGEPFRRYRQSGSGWVELEPVAALGYDGGGIAFSPDGRITFTATDGIRWTGPSTAKHVTDGSVVTYRLDSGQYRTMWGRVFIDACIPPNTSVALRFLTADDDDDILDPVEATGPDRGARPVPEPEATPPMPSQLRLNAARETAPKPCRLYRRPTGRERAWTQIPADDPFETYEAPVNAPPGRYLWLDVSLHGTARVSPRVRAIRVERPGHRLLKTLPKSWSRQDIAASFMHRFLAPTEGMLHQLDQQSALRAVLLDPHTTPQEAIAWLASFAGLVLDRRWPDDARRQLVAEAYTLFRRRGTKESLLRILEIYLGRAPVIVETWQLRGLGGTVLGTEPGGPPPPHVGASLRETGTLGRFTVGGQVPGEDSYHLAAHRFTVLIPSALNAEQRAVVNHILDIHRPAHTMGSICELGTGMRVGTQIRIAITTFVGPPSWFSPTILGHTNIGDDGFIGTPSVGTRLGEGIAGAVRVG